MLPPLALFSPGIVSPVTDLVSSEPTIVGVDVEIGDVVALYAGRSRRGPWFEVLNVLRTTTRGTQVLVPVAGGPESVWKGIVDEHAYPARPAPAGLAERAQLVQDGHFVAATPEHFPTLRPPTRRVPAPSLPMLSQSERDDNERRADLTGWPDLTGGTVAEVAEAIRKLIDAGVLKQGERFPSEQRIAWRTHVPRSVAREAKALLQRDGVLWRIPGRGVYVGRPAREQLPKRPGPSVRPVVGNRDSFLPGWPELGGKDAAAIAAAVRELIRSGVLKQGKKLPNQDLVAERTHARPSAVRAAWKRLSAEAVIRFQPGRGYFARHVQEENR